MAKSNGKTASDTAATSLPLIQWAQMQERMLAHTQRMLARQNELMRSMMTEGMRFFHAAAAATSAEEQRQAQQQWWQWMNAQVTSSINDWLREMVQAQAELNQSLNEMMQQSVRQWQKSHGNGMQAYDPWTPLAPWWPSANPSNGSTIDPVEAMREVMERSREAMVTATQMTTEAWQRLLGIPAASARPPENGAGTDKPAAASSR